ncbi:MAG: hypothetical protein AUI14_06655 [Actinobacteria bacterium 13_2_20CM_2_71_6]|nr:MAG: hypothetical protein AUI14_06655 [Actinobacteria bacterium 13_2_20CM_2_71_6]
MRRLLAVVALGGLALAGAGCGAKPVPPPAAAPTSASPSSDPYAANTHEVCATVNQVVADGVARFGSDVGALAGHLTGGNKPEADKARAAALARLKDLAGKGRNAGQPAADPAVAGAVGTVADRLDALAADPTLLAGVKTVADTPAVNKRVTTVTEALTGVCV